MKHLILSITKVCNTTPPLKCIWCSPVRYNLHIYNILLCTITTVYMQDFKGIGVKGVKKNKEEDPTYTHLEHCLDGEICCWVLFRSDFYLNSFKIYLWISHTLTFLCDRGLNLKIYVNQANKPRIFWGHSKSWSLSECDIDS